MNTPQAPLIQSDTTSVVVQGGAATIAVTFLHQSIEIAVPFLYVAGAVILADLYFGVKAALKRGEDVTVGTAVRRTIGKVFEYLAWVVLGSTLGAAYGNPDVTKWIIGGVIFIELLSVGRNYLFLHGKKITGLEEFFKGLFKDKTGHDASMIQITDAKAPSGKTKKKTEK